MIRSLYLSHNGMTEPLGRSQVLPYLAALAREGVRLEIVAFEPAGTSENEVANVRALLARAGIGYRPLRRRADSRLVVKASEITQAFAAGLREAASFRPHIVHCRSYVPAAAGDVLATLSPGAKLLFDCRGMLGDEYVDAGRWTEHEARYRILKLAERRFFKRADGVVVLTEALAQWVREREMLGPLTEIRVVPCCVDLERFRVDERMRSESRRRLGLGDEPVIVYSGTLGSWYQENEMAEFVAAAHRRDPRVRFHVLTRADAAPLRAALDRRAFPSEHLRVTAVRPDDMPTELVAGDIGLSFIKPCFSKMGSSPTKLAEYLACGHVVVANEGIGDAAELRAEADTCVTLRSFDSAEITRAAERALTLANRPWSERVRRGDIVARRRFGLAEVGAPRYLDLYRALART